MILPNYFLENKRHNYENGKKARKQKADIVPPRAPKSRPLSKDGSTPGVYYSTPALSSSFLGIVVVLSFVRVTTHPNTSLTLSLGACALGSRLWESLS